MKKQDCRTFVHKRRCGLRPRETTEFTHSDSFEWLSVRSPFKAFRWAGQTHSPKPSPIGWESTPQASTACSFCEGQCGPITVPVDQKWRPQRIKKRDFDS